MVVLSFFVFTSRISGRGNVLGHVCVCVSVCLSFCLSVKVTRSRLQRQICRAWLLLDAGSGRCVNAGAFSFFFFLLFLVTRMGQPIETMVIVFPLSTLPRPAILQIHDFPIGKKDWSCNFIDGNWSADYLIAMVWWSKMFDFILSTTCIYLTAKQQDNTFGSVHPSVPLSGLAGPLLH